MEAKDYQRVFELTTSPLWVADFSSLAHKLETIASRAGQPELLLRGIHPSALLELAAAVEIIDANAATLRLLEASHKAEVLGPLSRILAFDNMDVWADVFASVVQSQTTDDVEVWLKTLGAENVPVLLSFASTKEPTDLKRVVITMIDISKRRQLEDQMRAAQRMEAVGRLAGGIAHDFNNLLTVVASYCGFLRDRQELADDAREEVDVIMGATERATSLTNQLLAFSRRQLQRVENIDINASIEGLNKILRRLIGEDVELHTLLEPNLDLVKADRSQIEQVIMNLVVNARDAMPQGGQLLIETSNVELDQAYSHNKPADIAPGPYVMLAVTDTGMGMDHATQLKVFEPFFTTKVMGKGTGLGLSTVYGIVKQSRGFVWVYSEPGQGAVFKVYLPRSESRELRDEFHEVTRSSVHDYGGHETILLVEDDDLVRQAALRILRQAGYQVIEGRNGEEALSLLQLYPGTVHAILTDMVMPKMGGPELAETVRKDQPTMRILYMSGYTDAALGHQGLLEGATSYVQKPFSAKLLLQRVRQVLDHSPSN